MSLAFLSDQCVPAEIASILEHHGHKVTPLRNILPIRSPDSAVIAKAQALGLVLLSLNGDFADIFDYPPASYGGIIAIQLRNHPEAIPPLISRLTAFLAANPNREFYQGKLLIVEPHRIRIRE
jgi:predicted nuclease of predicted toxin-antitoxin system